MHRGEYPSLPVDPIPSAALDFTLQVERLYSALIHTARTPDCVTQSLAAEPDQEPSLGGKLLYAGELEPHGRALLVAGNIAGAASLAATADAAARKQAIRDGVADFLVNSLDEALRILKNEIRKRETVAVCVAAAPEAVEREMLELGVLPDLLAPLSFAGSSSSQLFGQAVHRIERSSPPGSQSLVIWSVDSAPAQWLPKLDALAIECLQRNASPESSAACRWLRLAPRYLGRLAETFRVLHCQPDTANEFVSRVQRAVNRKQIGVDVRIGMNGEGQVFLFQPSDPANSDSRS
jgi:urocanase-like protein